MGWIGAFRALVAALILVMAFAVPASVARAQTLDPIPVEPLAADPANGQRCARPVRMGWEPWAPHQYQRQDGSITGIDVDMMLSAMGRLGCPLVLVGLPWSVLQEEIKAGRVDFAAGLARTAEREVWGLYGRPYAIQETVFFVRAEDRDRLRGIDFGRIVTERLKLGITREFHYGDAFRDRFDTDRDFRERIFTARLDPQHIPLLLDGRIDAFLALRSVGISLARQAGVENLVVPADAPLVDSGDLYVVGSRRTVTSDLMDALDREIRRLYDDGTMTRIYTRHIGQASFARDPFAAIIRSNVIRPRSQVTHTAN